MYLYWYVYLEIGDKKKFKIMEVFKKLDSDLRFIVVISVLGMGVDFVGFYNVILYECFKFVVDFV